jgi:hypothetical protein
MGIACFPNNTAMKEHAMTKRQYYRTALTLAKDDPHWIREVIAAQGTKREGGDMRPIHYRILRLALRDANA